MANRGFAPKAAGKGGPAVAASAFAPKRGKTAMEKHIESGAEFIMGVPPGANKG